jgi:hypothetical protein
VAPEPRSSSPCAQLDDNTDSDTGASSVRSTLTGTDAGTHSSWSADSFLAFATTIFTTSARELGADIVSDSAAYDR